MFRLYICYSSYTSCLFILLVTFSVNKNILLDTILQVFSSIPHFKLLHFVTITYSTFGGCFGTWVWVSAGSFYQQESCLQSVKCGTNVDRLLCRQIDLTHDTIYVSTHVWKLPALLSHNVKTYIIQINPDKSFVSDIYFDEHCRRNILLYWVLDAL